MQNKYISKDNSLMFVDTSDFIKTLRSYAEGELSSAIRLEADWHSCGRILVNASGAGELLFALCKLGGGVNLVEIQAIENEGTLTLIVSTTNGEAEFKAIAGVIRAARNAGFDATILNNSITLKTKNYGPEYITVYARNTAPQTFLLSLDEAFRKSKLRK